jgi:hypothetical protein
MELNVIAFFAVTQRSGFAFKVRYRLSVSITTDNDNAKLEQDFIFFLLHLYFFCSFSTAVFFSVSFTSLMAVSLSLFTAFWLNGGTATPP